MVAVVCAGVGLAGCRTTQVTSGTGTSMPPPTEAARPGFVPQGATLQVRLDRSLGADTSKEGDRFSATVQSPLVGGNGDIVVPVGTVLNGHVSQLKRSSHVGEQAAIALAFDSIRVGGRESPIDAEVVATDVKGGTPEGGRAGVGGAIGGAAGSVLGAIFGGSWGAAFLGGVLGAATGTLIGLGTGDVDPKLPAGTQLSVRTTAPVQVAVARGTGPY
jgi:hypothetical protein